LVQDIELDEEKFRFRENDDVFSISNVLKQCRLTGKDALYYTDSIIDLRELPEPVFGLPHAERVKHTENRGERITFGGGADRYAEESRRTYSQQLCSAESAVTPVTAYTSDHFPGDH
jgi:hypothetical protein